MALAVSRPPVNVVSVPWAGSPRLRASASPRPAAAQQCRVSYFLAVHQASPPPVCRLAGESNQLAAATSFSGPAAARGSDRDGIPQAFILMSFLWQACRQLRQ